jgi:hypothetical protein
MYDIIDNKMIRCAEFILNTFLQCDKEDKQIYLFHVVDTK